MEDKRYRVSIKSFIQICRGRSRGRGGQPRGDCPYLNGQPRGDCPYLNGQPRGDCPYGLRAIEDKR